MIADNHDLLSISLFFIYELCVFFSSLRILYIVLGKTLDNGSKKEFFLTSIAISIILSSMIAAVISFLKSNGLIEYLLSASVLVIVLHFTKPDNLKRYGDFILSLFDKSDKILFNWKSIVIFSLLSPLFLMAIRPFEDYDSMFIAKFMLNWLFNHTTPYTNAFDYVSTWNLTFLPSMVITHTDWFFWIDSVKPVFIIGLGLYLIGYKIGIPKILNYSAILAGMLFVSYWGTSYSGIGTLKDDAVVAAGIILIALATLEIINKGFNRINSLILIIAFVFISIKYSGIPVMAISVILIIIFKRREIANNYRKIIGWSLIAVLVLLLTNGHYYIFNLLQYGNPFYPIKVTVLGLGFSNGNNLQSTSIIS